MDGNKCIGHLIHTVKGWDCQDIAGRRVGIYSEDMADAAVARLRLAAGIST